MTRQRLPSSTASARRLRREMNDVEGLLWWRLRDRRAGCRYRRQVPIGRYVVDFACLRHRLVIECDGNQHLDRQYDRRRDRDLAARGFRVLRIWDWEIVKDLDATVARITQACASSPIAPHEVGEGAGGRSTSSPTKWGKGPRRTE